MFKPNQTKPNQTKPLLYNVLTSVLIPLFLLWSFLFFLFWSAPLSLILQMYDIGGLYIKNNLHIKIINIVTASFGAILLVTVLIPHKISQIINRIFIGIIVFTVVFTCLYNVILPYNYGSFIDDATLTTGTSLLGFSKWYYLLDVLIIGGSIVSAYYIKNTPKVLLLFIIFYSIENIQTFAKGLASRNSTSQKENSSIFFDTTSITRLSKNHKNILYYAYDGWGPTLAKYFLTNETSFTPEEKAWAKDFTFYDNVVALSFANTITSFPSMYEGYKKAPQVLLKNMLEQNKYSSYIYREPLTIFSNDLSPYADTLNVGSSMSLTGIPILLPKVYASIPYFIRGTIAHEFSWKYKNYTEWVVGTSYERLIYTAIETDKPQILYFLSDLTHVPWNSSTIKVTNYSHQMSTVEQAEEVLFYNTKDVFTELTDLIQQLKDLGVYDNTKIIVLSDHDTHWDVQTLIQLAENVGPNPSFGDYIQGKVHHPYSTLMIKEFNTSQNKMQINHKFLTLADIRGNIEHSLGLTDLPDFIRDDYVDRVVNIPRVWIDDFYELLNDDKRRDAKRRLTNVDIFKIKNINPIDFEVVNIPISEVENIPPYEIIK